MYIYVYVYITAIDITGYHPTPTRLLQMCLKVHLIIRRNKIQHFLCVTNSVLGHSCAYMYARACKPLQSVLHQPIPSGCTALLQVSPGSRNDRHGRPWSEGSGEPFPQPAAQRLVPGQVGQWLC